MVAAQQRQYSRRGGDPSPRQAAALHRLPAAATPHSRSLLSTPQLKPWYATCSGSGGELKTGPQRGLVGGCASAPPARTSPCLPLPSFPPLTLLAPPRVATALCSASPTSSTWPSRPRSRTAPRQVSLPTSPRPLGPPGRSRPLLTSGCRPHHRRLHHILRLRLLLLRVRLLQNPVRGQDIGHQDDGGEDGGGDRLKRLPTAYTTIE